MTNANDLRDGARDDQRLQLDLLDSAEAGDDAETLRVRLSRRARRLSVRVYPDARVEVVAPPRMRPAEIERFVAAHRPWIEAKRAQALRNRPVPEEFPPSTIALRLTGELLTLKATHGSARARITEGAGGATRELRIDTRAPLRPALRAWLMRVARARLEERVAARAATMGVRYARIAIRRQRSRWGSCSARGTISLNCCLLFQRPEVVDYLIVHELAHVSHMNHSARFWKLVEAHCPDWRSLDRELLEGWRHVPRWVFADR